MGSKKLSKEHSKQIQEHIKNNNYADLISEIQGYYSLHKLYHIDRIKDRNHVIITLYIVVKAFMYIQ